MCVQRVWNPIPVFRHELEHLRFFIDELEDVGVSGPQTPRVSDRYAPAITCPTRKRVLRTVYFQLAISIQT